MVVDAVQSYLNLANAMSRAARAQAVAVARSVLAQTNLEEAAEEANDRATRLAEEARDARRANRELVQTLVTTELAKAATRFGFVRSDDLDELREEIAELRVQLRKAQATGVSSATTTAASSTRVRTSARKTTTPAAAKPATGTVPPAKKAAAKRTAAKKAEAAGADAGPAPDPTSDAGA